MPKKSAAPKFVQLRLGEMPIALINRTLGLELEPGDIIFSPPAQLHAYRRHPEDFPKCLPFVGSVVSNPLYLGDDTRNPGKIEMISRISGLGSSLLVALSIEMDIHGQYHVASLYPVSDRKIDGRLKNRTIRPAKK